MNSHHDDDNHKMDDDSMKIRTMDIPVWLSTPEVTKYLVGHGRAKALQEEYECVVFITGHGSGSKDPNLPGNDLPYQLITMSGTDNRNLGRIRRDLEDKLIDYIIEHTPSHAHVSGGSVNPPPSLGRLLYHFGLSASNAQPNTKDHRPDRTVLARSHFPFSLHTMRERGIKSSNPNHLPTKKVWMNVMELPRDESTGEYHGRFLVSRVCKNNYMNMECRVDIYGVWGGKGADDDDGDDNGEEDHHDGGGGSELLRDPYVLITGSEKSNVDRCVQFIEYRIREHEEQFGLSRASGRRVLRADRFEG